MSTAPDMAAHRHTVARTVPGAVTWRSDGTAIGHYTDWCACGAHSSYSNHTDRDGFTFMGIGLWAGGIPEGCPVPAATSAPDRGARCRRCNGDRPAGAVADITQLCDECARSIMRETWSLSAATWIDSKNPRVQGIEWVELHGASVAAVRSDGFDQRAVDAAKAVLLSTAAKRRP